MTAEIAIMNPQGVALAADSAVTIGRGKVWKTANKLFSLSPYNDIGIMIYGNGGFIGFPWETLIKCFRQNVGKQQFLTVKECADAFFTYLQSAEISNIVYEKASVVSLFYEKISSIKNLANKCEFKSGFNQQVRDSIILQISRLEQTQVILEVDYKQFLDEFKNTIFEILKDFFNEEKEQIEDLMLQLCYEVYRRATAAELDAGIVVAGFGRNEFFPCLLNYTLSGKYKSVLRLWLNAEHDFNQSNGQGAAVLPFAQSDMSNLFMQGITQQNLFFIIKILHSKLQEKSGAIIRKYVKHKDTRNKEINEQSIENKIFLDKFLKEFFNYCSDSFAQPILEVVSSLPKEEMAAMAEALVELTTLRRKMDSMLESVGGPTDVALISKGDGFVWIKRKQYFDINLNKEFLRRKELLD